MRLLLALVGLALVLGSPADAAHAPRKGHTAKRAHAKKAARPSAFDGRYAGRLIPQGGTPGCGLHQIRDFEISKGTIVPASAAPSLTPVFDGLVTDDGFITGHMRLIETVVPFEGRAEKKGPATVISGGVIDDASRCVWVLNLTMQ